jgi:Peptidase family M48
MASSVAGAAKRIQLLTAAIAAFGAMLVAGILARAIGTVSVGATSTPTVRVLGLELTAPAANLAALVVLALAALGTAVVLAGARSWMRQLRAQRAFRRTLGPRRRLEGPVPAEVIADRRPAAFCAGYLRPRIYVSEGALGRLTQGELRAVLAHEAEHRRRRDPLRLACARVLCDALFFLPVLRDLGERYTALAELLADEAAVRANAGDPAPIAAAMLAFGEDTDEAVVGIAPERVDHLLGRKSDWGLPLLTLLLSVIGSFCVVALAWQLGSHALLRLTLNPPVLSRQPCVVVLAAIAAAPGLAALALRKRTREAP